MKINFTAVLLSVTLFGCTTTNHQEQINDVAVDYWLEKLETNGPDLFCSEQAYLNCYNINEQQCKNDLSVISDECLSKAKNKFKKLDTQDIIDEFSDYYVFCLAMEHAFNSLPEIKEISECFKQIKIDKEKSLKELLK